MSPMLVYHHKTGLHRGKNILATILEVAVTHLHTTRSLIREQILHLLCRLLYLVVNIRRGLLYVCIQLLPVYWRLPLTLALPLA